MSLIEIIRAAVDENLTSEQITLWALQTHIFVMLLLSIYGVSSRNGFGYTLTSGGVIYILSQGIEIYVDSLSTWPRFQELSGNSIPEGNILGAALACFAMVITSRFFSKK